MGLKVTQTCMGTAGYLEKYERTHCRAPKIWDSAARVDMGGFQTGHGHCGSNLKGG